MKQNFDILIIGSGISGLIAAIKLSANYSVAVLTKTKAHECNSIWAQGGIAAVSSKQDSFEDHIQDTISAGAGLPKKKVVDHIIRQAPQRIEELKQWGVHFDSYKADVSQPDLTKEGGHSKRRILHIEDHTGEGIHSALLKTATAKKNIQILEKHFAIDLITTRKLSTSPSIENICLGAYVYDQKKSIVKTITANFSILATGGAGKIYKYTTNWSGASGDGIAMAYRAGARVSNLEFMQFHPTLLYHQEEKNFLITEAIRGEGAKLVNSEGTEFMLNKHKLGALAPRDIVARNIDAEMKRTGAACVYLDVRHLDSEFIKQRFPVIYKKCFQLGIDITKDLIPVVPAAHYLCGGVLSSAHGETDIKCLLAIGETSCTGLHGANRLASNSLLECTTTASDATNFIFKHFETAKKHSSKLPDWHYHNYYNADEMVVINHLWDEIRNLMWNYVGILRSNKRLKRAQERLSLLNAEIKDYYWNFKLHPDILELRNLGLVAKLSVDCALKRNYSIGIHYNIDQSEASATDPLENTIL